MRFTWIALLAAALATLYTVPARAVDPSPAATLPPYQTLSPVRILGIARRVFRSHRPPPAYEVYTMVRTQMTNYGYPDPVGSYTTKYWVRNSDRAALTRRMFRDDYEGDLVFQRPELNEATDPGPPTADVFAPAPIRQHLNPLSYVPTPEPSGESTKTIASVVSIGESDYDVPQMAVEGQLLHLTLRPRRDPERNVLRQVWIDKHSYELRKIIAHDRLFTDDQGVFPVTFTYTLGYLQNVLVITKLHGIVEPRAEKDGTQTVYDGDGRTVDFDFQDIAFPNALPPWYFDPRDYAQNKDSAPT